ncbi:MAG: NADH-quinone oxidoreductase subunit NuoE [Halanaerobiales bacterium]|nr:NADH-quinone oxidoreductase subunit NuoE [Halanaerobiales bacterium]
MDIDLNSLDPIIDKFIDKRGNLIPILNEVQQKIGYLPIEVQEYVSEKLNIPMSKIYGVVSFYSFFQINPSGEHTIGLCMGTACYVKGAEGIMEKLKSYLDVDIGETSQDGKFTLTLTRCLGTCSLAPVMMIDDDVHGSLVPDEIPKILDEY